MTLILMLMVVSSNLFASNVWASPSDTKNGQSQTINTLDDNFKVEGGIGRKLKMYDFISESNKKISGIQLLKLPPTANPNSIFKWLRTPDSYKLIDSFLQKGACIFVVNFPSESQEGALTLHEAYPGIKDLLQQVKASKNNGSVMFIRPDSTKDVISHEGQHWLDTMKNNNNTDSIATSLSKDFNQIIKQNLGVDREDLIYLNTVIIEQRGYASQQKTLKEDSELHLSYIPEASDKELIKDEAVKARTRASRLLDEVFSSTFPVDQIKTVLDKYQNQQKYSDLQKRLLDILEKYQIKGYEKLEFQYMLSIYFK